MDNVQLLMASLLVLIICLVVWFTTWNDYNNTKPVQNPQDASDDQDNNAYYAAKYCRKSNIVKVVGAIAALSAIYFYSNISSSDAHYIWGGDPTKDSEDADNYDGGLIVPIGTPVPSSN